MKKLLNNKKGFTLMEAVISIGIMALMILAFAFMIGVASRQNAASAETLQQFNAAQYKMETGNTEEREKSALLTINGIADSVDITLNTAEDGDVSLYSFEVAP